MNIQAIRLFLHVIRRGSLAAAAGELNMSPSAASRLLSGLERSTGLKLFSREGQRLRPTAEGEQYYLECHRVLVAVDELPRVARRLASGAQSRIKFAVTSRLATALAMPALERFAKAYPDVEIEFEIYGVRDIGRIRMGVDFDIALAAPVPTGIPAIEVVPLFDLPLTVVMRRDHPLARRNFLRVADLAGHKLIATAMGPGREDLERTFRAEGLEPKPLYTVSAVDLGCKLVLRTNAVILTDPTVLLGPDREDYAVVPLKPMRMIQVSMVTQALKPESRLVRAFKACLQQEAKTVEKKLSRLVRIPSGNSRK